MVLYYRIVEYLENVPHIKNSGYDMVTYFFIAYNLIISLFWHDKRKIDKYQEDAQYIVTHNAVAEKGNAERYQCSIMRKLNCNGSVIWPQGLLLNYIHSHLQIILGKHYVIVLHYSLKSLDHTLSIKFSFHCHDDCHLYP